MRAVVRVVALGSVWAELALAGPTCQADQVSKTVAECLAEIDPGGEITLTDGVIHTVPTLILVKDVTIRSRSPSVQVVVQHEPRITLPNPVFGSSYPIAVPALIQARSGAKVNLIDLDLRPFRADTEIGSFHLGRAIEVDGKAEVRAERIRVADVVAPRRSGPSSMAGGYAGWVSGAGSLLTVVDSEVDNIDAFEHFGGAFFADLGGEIRIVGRTQVTGNQAYKGGGVYVRYGGVVRVDRAGDVPTFQLNKGVAAGGAIGAQAEGSRIEIIEGTFVDNQATNYGGHLYSADAALEVAAGTFESGLADHGGAIYADQGTLSVSGAYLVGNRARRSGGAVYAADVAVGAESLHLRDNQVPGTAGMGGAWYQESGTLTLRAVKFEGSAAGRGGAVALQDVSSVDVSVAWFFDNVASVEGGALLSSGAGGSDKLGWSRFCGNQAPKGSAMAFPAGAQVRALSLTHNLIDGYAASTAATVSVDSFSYSIAQNNFIRGAGPAVVVNRSTGEFRRNFLGWQDAETSIDVIGGDAPTLVENAWWDALGVWTAPVRYQGAAFSNGSGAVLEAPRFTGLDGGGDLAIPCDEREYTLRPDSPLLLVPWQDDAVRFQQIGMYGGEGSPSSPWSDDADVDGVVAFWDCDEADDAVGVTLEQYRDGDGDGYAGTPFTEGWPCHLVDGNALTAEDCDDADVAVWDTCDGDTDVPGEAVVTWYGSCDGTGGWWAWGAAAVLVARRRRR